MNIWRIMADPNRYRSFDSTDITPSQSVDLTQKFRSGQALGADWTTFRVKLFEYESEESQEEKPIGDFPSFAGIVPLFISALALKILHPLIKNNVEVLNVLTDIGTFYALNVFTCNCLDQTKSVFVRFDDGGIMRVERYAFRPGSLEGKHIFRIPEVWSNTFVDEAFKQTVEENRLEGLVFYQVPMVEEV